MGVLMDAIFWACRHTERNVAESGLQLLYSFIEKVTSQDIATVFYRKYYVTILKEVFDLLTDTLHKPGFRSQARILHHLFGVARVV